MPNDKLCFRDLVDSFIDKDRSPKERTQNRHNGQAGRSRSPRDVAAMSGPMFDYQAPDDEGSDENVEDLDVGESASQCGMYDDEDFDEDTYEQRCANFLLSWDRKRRGISYLDAEALKSHRQ